MRDLVQVVLGAADVEVAQFFLLLFISCLGRLGRLLCSRCVIFFMASRCFSPCLDGWLFYVVFGSIGQLGCFRLFHVGLASFTLIYLVYC